jgi:uncharacterized membrane protein
MSVPPVVAEAPVPVTTRLSSVDTVRGIAMVLMALDHVRDWVSSVRFQPENLALTTPALFATRWVTHFCAPAFFLLAGIGIGIAFNRGIRGAAMSRYLLVRGFWLLVLELVITPAGWQFGFTLVPAFALVLWALGWSMILMAGAVHLPRVVIATIALAMIAGHNLLDPIRPDAFGEWRALWHVLHVPGFVIPDVLFVAYPLVPWVGVMAFGFVLAGVYDWDDGRRRKLLFIAGAAALVAFAALRAANGYGDPVPWSSQRTPALTVASFLNLRKYPPSLLFLLMTLGPALMLLAFAERWRGRFAAFLSIYGRVPLFFYVMHIFVAHAIAILLAYAQSGQWRRIAIITDLPNLPAWYGLTLPGVYAVWITVVLLLYYPCRRFAHLKNTRRGDWWLKYM